MPNSKIMRSKMTQDTSPQSASITDESSKDSNYQATVKHRRLQTLIKKTVDLAQKCNLHLNLLVFDQKLVKLTEYFTDTDVMLENAHKLVQESRDKTNSFRKRRDKFDRYLVLRSVNATERVKGKSKKTKVPSNDAKLTKTANES